MIFLPDNFQNLIDFKPIVTNSFSFIKIQPVSRALSTGELASNFDVFQSYMAIELLSSSPPESSLVPSGEKFN